MTAASLLLPACTGTDGAPDDAGGDLAARIEAHALVIGAVDTLPGHMLHQVTGARLTADGRIVVANGGTSQIRVFDGSGALVAEMGGSGTGPGEFLALRGIVLAGDSVLAWDPLTRRVSVWSLDGELRDTWPVRTGFPPRLIGRSSDGRLILATTHATVPRGLGAWATYADSVEVSVFDPADGAVEPVGTFPDLAMVAADASEQGGPPRLAVGVPDGPRAAVAAAGGRIWVAHGGSGSARVFDADGAPLGEVPLPLAARVRGPDAVEAAIATALDAVPRAQRAATRRYLERFPQPETYPRFDHALADDDGRLWLRAYVTAADTLATWVVLAEDGRTVASPVLPARFRPTQVTGPWILGTARGEHDIETVVLLADAGRARGRAAARSP